MAIKGQINEKQKRFVHEYLIDLNASAAALRAGYSKSKVQSRASQLLAMPGVKAYYLEKAKEIEAASAISAVQVIDEIAKIAFADIRKVIKWEDGKMIITDSEAVDEATGASIAEYSITHNKFGTIQRVKMHSKIQALDMLCRKFGIYVQAEAEVNSTTNTQVIINMPNANGN